MTKPVIKFTVPGAPVPWARARSKGAQRFTPPEVRAFKQVVRWAVTRAGWHSRRKPLKVAVIVEVQFFFKKKRAKKQVEVKATRPDLDNLVKCVLDALNGLIFEDDGQVVGITADKYWAPKDDEPRTAVRIYEAL